MKKLIFRNIAILSAIFIVTLSIMLVTNYFQIKVLYVILMLFLIHLNNLF